MKIRLLISRASAFGSQAAGSIVEVSADEAKRLLSRGLAEAADAPPQPRPPAQKPETATKAAPRQSEKGSK